MNLLSNLKKIRVQHVDRDAKGVEIKTDVDVITDADCITMDDGDLRSGVKKMIDDRIGEVIDGAPEQLDTLKEIATELEKNQSGVSTILNKMNAKLEEKDLEAYAKTTDVDKKLMAKVEAVNGKGLSTNDYTNEGKEKLSNLSEGIKKIKIDDLNDLTEEGDYIVDTIKNGPVPNKELTHYDSMLRIIVKDCIVPLSFYIKVIHHTIWAGGKAPNPWIDYICIRQVAICDDIYIREKGKDDTWTPWTKLASTDDLKNLKLADLKDDEKHRTVTDAEKAQWNSVDVLTTQEVEGLCDEIFR